jgi:hypothetical protein
MRRAGWEIWFVREIDIIHYRRQSMRQYDRLQEIRCYMKSMFTWLKKIYLQAWGHQIQVRWHVKLKWK